MYFRLGIDLGGTTAKIVLLDPNQKIIERGLIMTACQADPTAIIDAVAALCETLRKDRRVSHIGIGVAGVIDIKTGDVSLAPNLGWKNIPLRALLSKKLRRPVIVENDATAAALGIYQTQIPKYIKDVIVVTLGTGVGGGVILNGQIHRGRDGTAGEIGHMIIVEHGRPCSCGQRGCLEAYVGGRQIVKMVKEEIKKGRTSLLKPLYLKSPDLITPQKIAEAAKRGDPVAKNIWTNFGHTLGLALQNLIYLLNPGMIYLTGGIAQAGTLILKPLKETLRTGSIKEPLESVQIRIAQKPEFIGAFGAALL